MAKAKSRPNKPKRKASAAKSGSRSNASGKQELAAKATASSAAKASATSGGRKATTKKTAGSSKRNQTSWVTVPDPSHPRKTLQVAVPERSASSAADQDEAAFQAKVLDQNQQISRSGGALQSGETHAVEELPTGERRLVRKRFSAI